MRAMGYQDSFQLATVDFPHSKRMWIGELAPHTVRLIVKEPWAVSKFRLCLQCTAQELAEATERTQDSIRLLEDEFEAYLIDSCSVFQSGLDARVEGGCSGRLQEGAGSGIAETPNCPSLLRISTTGSKGYPFVLAEAGAEPECVLDSVRHLGIMLAASSRYQARFVVSKLIECKYVHHPADGI